MCEIEKNIRILNETMKRCRRIKIDKDRNLLQDYGKELKSAYDVNLQSAKNMKSACENAKFIMQNLYDGIAQIKENRKKRLGKLI